MMKMENDPVQTKTVWRYDPHLHHALQFDPGRAKIEKLIDNSLKSRIPMSLLREGLEKLRYEDVVKVLVL